VVVGTNLNIFSGPPVVHDAQPYDDAQLLSPPVVPVNGWPHVSDVALAQLKEVQGTAGHEVVSVNVPDAPFLPSTTI
jgi:hypothetical protein